MLSIFSCVCYPSVSSLEKYLSSSSAHFLIGSFIFLILSCMSCLYIFEINSLSVASFAIIFSHSEGCLKHTDKRMKRLSPIRKKIFAKGISDKELLSKIYKKFLKLNNNKTNNSVKKWTKGLNRHITKEDIQIVYKHTKRYSTSYVFKEMKIKTM